MNWYDTPSRIRFAAPKKHKRKVSLGPIIQCNCGAAVRQAHWGDHLAKGNHRAKVEAHKKKWADYFAGLRRRRA